MEGVVWNELSDKRRNIIVSKTKKLANKYKNNRAAHKGTRVSILFSVTKKMHQGIAKKKKILYLPIIGIGWIKGGLSYRRIENKIGI